MSEKSDSYASEARNFVTVERFAVLSTISVSQQGFPFGSIVPYDLTPEGGIVIYISLIAEHYKNLIKDARASLTVVDHRNSPDPQAHARATLLLRFSQVSPELLNLRSSSYQNRFPQSENHELAHNFVYMEAVPEKLRWIGGFGDIAWVSREAWLSASLDRLSYIAKPILEHMNQDHHEALQEFVSAYSNFSPKDFQIQMCGITSANFSIALCKGDQEELVTIPFDNTIADAEQARVEIVRLLKKIRAVMKT